MGTLDRQRETPNDPKVADTSAMLQQLITQLPVASKWIVSSIQNMDVGSIINALQVASAVPRSDSLLTRRLQSSQFQENIDMVMDCEFPPSNSELASRVCSNDNFWWLDPLYEVCNKSITLPTLDVMHVQDPDTMNVVANFVASKYCCSAVRTQD